MIEFFTNWTNYLILIVAIISIIALIMTIKSRNRNINKDSDVIIPSRYMRDKLIHDPEFRYRYMRELEEYPSELRRKIIHDRPLYYGGEQRALFEEDKKEKSIYDKKKEKFLKIANISFHFADKERIRTFYDDYFKEPTIKNLINESISESDSGLKASIPSILESKIGGKDLSKWISKIKLPDITENGMFKRYQKETIQKDQVQLGLEEDDIELSLLSEFEEQVNEISSEFDFSLEKEKVEAHKTKLKEKAADRTLKTLEKASGWVLIEGKFLIQKEKENFYKVTMTHPVSNYLPADKDVKISCLIPIDQIEPSVAGNYSNSLNKSIPLRIYGQIWQPLNRDENVWELMITPLAIY
jgi:hypothetical protein